MAELAVEAERNLARLMGEAEGNGADSRTDPRPESQISAPPPTGSRVRLFDQRDELEAGPAITSTSDLAEKVDTLSAELVALGRAMTQALDSTNDRLAAVERLLRTRSSPTASAEERAAARLRLKLRQAAEGGAASPGTSPLPPS